MVLRLTEQPEVVFSPERNEPRADPLFLIHDGSGICVQYHQLESFNRATFAIHDSKFLSTEAWSSIPEMAKSYAQCIVETTPGPYIVGGWSFGGVVAYETARVLMSQGYIVKGVLLIDSPPPLDHQPLSSNIIDAVTKRGDRRGGPIANAVRDLVRQSFTACASMLAAFNPRSIAYQSRQNPQTFLLRSRDGFEFEASQDHAQVENAWLQDRSDPRSSLEGWEILTEARVPYMDIPGNHFQVFDAANVSRSYRIDPREYLLTVSHRTDNNSVACHCSCMRIFHKRQASRNISAEILETA